MKIVISQQDKRIKVIFQQNSIADSYEIDKADDFLACVDKFLKRRDNLKNDIAKAGLEFINAGMLTERIIRAIIAGLRF